jgi:hypothetical protein
MSIERLVIASDCKERGNLAVLDAANNGEFASPSARNDLWGRQCALTKKGSVVVIASDQRERGNLVEQWRDCFATLAMTHPNLFLGSGLEMLKSCAERWRGCRGAIYRARPPLEPSLCSGKKPHLGRGSTGLTAEQGGRQSRGPIRSLQGDMYDRSD